MGFLLHVSPCSAISRCARACCTTSVMHAQATQEVVSRLPEATPAEFNAAVQAAKDAFPKWRNTPLPTRSRIMLKLQELIRANMVLLSLTRRPYGCHTSWNGASK